MIYNIKGSEDLIEIFGGWVYLMDKCMYGDHYMIRANSGDSELDELKAIYDQNFSRGMSFEEYIFETIGISLTMSADSYNTTSADPDVCHVHTTKHGNVYSAAAIAWVLSPMSSGHSGRAEENI